MAVLAVLVAGGIGTYVWALGHWFVGVEGGEGEERVAVFRGLDVSVVGLDLYRLDEETDLAVSDLTPAARNRVQGGITADDPSDAERILSALRSQRLELCRTLEEEQSASADATPPATSSPTPTEPPAGDTAAGDTATDTGPLAAGTDTTEPPTSARTTRSPEPGVDCREAK